MTDRQDSEQPLEELEALIRSAGNFVESSDCLRPRVLETARDERRRRRAQERISTAAALVLALGVFLSLGGQPETSELGQPGFLREGGPLSAHSATVVDQNGSAWEMVDSLTELRRRQAVLLRASL